MDSLNADSRGHDCLDRVSESRHTHDIKANGIVINSGHTFHEQEFAAFNYLLFPRLGDWAMMKILPGSD